MKSILVANPKGGCGKTTIATNLASYYAMWGVKTALVDCDRQASSLEWLEARPAGFENIAAVDGTRGGRYAIPAGTQRVLLDAPAQLEPRRLATMLSHADVLLVPIMPSPIDIRSASHFIGEVLMSEDLGDGVRIGVVGNRVREQTIIYSKLEQFMTHVKIPFVTHLRDTQNYIRAAEQGIGIFEMAPYLVEADLEQWRPLIKWVEGKRR